MIEHTTDSSNPAEAATPHSLRRDSAGHIWTWKRTLEESEIARVREGTAALAERFLRARRLVRPILVTGINRSGTTWVGQTLARAPGVALVYEPFSPRHRRGILRAPTPAWFTYISGDPPAGSRG